MNNDDEDDGLTDAERRDGLLRAIDHAQRQSRSYQRASCSIRLCDGPLDNLVCSALCALLKENDMPWDVSIIDCAIHLSDRHPVPSTKVARSAFSGKINSIVVLNRDGNNQARAEHQRMLSCIFDPSSFVNSQMLTNLVLRNCIITMPVAQLMRRYFKYATNLDRLVLCAVSFSARGVGPADNAEGATFFELIRALFSRDWKEDSDPSSAAPRRNSSSTKGKRRSFMKRLSFSSRKKKGRTLPEPSNSTVFHPGESQLTKCPSVLKINSCGIDKEQAEDIIALLSESTVGLENLDLSDNPIETAPGNIRLLKGLKSLGLGGLSPTAGPAARPISVQSVIRSIATTNLVSLGLGFNPLTDGCINKLFDWLELRNRQQLLQLDIRAVNLTAVGRSRVLSYIGGNHMLKDLTMYGNIVDKEFSEEACQLLQTTNTNMVRLRADFLDPQVRTDVLAFGIRNWAGRELLQGQMTEKSCVFPVSLWSDVLARVSNLEDTVAFNEHAPTSHNKALRADAIYHLLREGTLLYSCCC